MNAGNIIILHVPSLGKSNVLHFMATTVEVLQPVWVWIFSGKRYWVDIL